MGYDEYSWDNYSGEEQQPWSTIKYWSSLTKNEIQAAKFLGYTEITWDNNSGKEPRPDAYYKYWDELTACGEGGDISMVYPYHPRLYHPS